jgi:hypothetical protein
MIDYLENLPVTEAEKLRKAIGSLFRQTCILQEKYDPVTLVPSDNEQYEICNRHKDFIEDYLSVMGCEMVHDAQEHVFRLVGEGAEAVTLSRTSTIILLLTKMIYRDKIMGQSLSATVTNLEELREYGKNTNLLNQKLTDGEWKEALSLMKKHQVIEYPGALRDLEDYTPIYIYSTINLYCSSAMINELLEAYREEADTDEARTVEENIYQNAD